MTAVTRREHDLLGDRDVPVDAYWGVHTLRATENSPITGTSISAYPHLIDALAAVKEAALISGRGVAELVLEKGLLPAETLVGLLRPEAVAGAGQVLA